MKLPILRTLLHITAWITIVYAISGCSTHKTLIILHPEGSPEYNKVLEQYSDIDGVEVQK